MAITFYEANRILNFEFGNTGYSVPGTLYWGLSTTAINNNGSGYTEPSATYAYARVPVTNISGNFTSAVDGVKTNIATVTFPESTGSWGTIGWVFVVDALTLGTGNVLYFETLTPSRTVLTGTTVYFTGGAITIQMLNP